MINPSILLQGRAPQLTDPLESYGRMMSLKQMAQEGPMRQQLHDQQVQLNQQRIADGDRTRQSEDRALRDQEAMRQVLAETNGDMEAALPKLASRISPTAFLGIQKAHLESKKTLAEIDDKRLAAKKDERSRLSALVSQAEAMPDDQYAAAWPQIAAAAKSIDPSLNLTDQPIPKAQLGTIRLGFITEEAYFKAEDERRKRALEKPTLDKAAAEATTATVQAGQMSTLGMTAKQKADLEDAEKDRKQREREGALNRGVTMTVAKMTDARQRDANSVAAKPLSAEAAKVVSVASTVRPEIEKLKQAFRTDYKGSVRGIVTGSNRELTRLADNIADKVGRLRSGGAINKEESDRFMRQIAHWRDMLSNDPKAAETAIAALDGLLSETDSVINSMKPQGGTQKPADPLGIR